MGFCPKHRAPSIPKAIPHARSLPVRPVPITDDAIVQAGVPLVPTRSAGATPSSLPSGRVAGLGGTLYPPSIRDDRAAAPTPLPAPGTALDRRGRSGALGGARRFPGPAVPPQAPGACKGQVTDGVQGGCRKPQSQGIPPTVLPQPQSGPSRVWAVRLPNHPVRLLWTIQRAPCKPPGPQ